MMPRLVALWRERWSATPGTTEADFPFGLVTLTPNGGEGSSDLGSFRFAQVGSWGTLPNPDMPRTWVAHGYDLSDPWVFCEDQNPATKECPGCDSADPLYNCLAPNEGPQIHSRLKKPVGQRLAAGALVTAYGFAGPVAGPTISGCTLAVAPSSASLTVTFAVAGGPMLVKPYGGAAFSGFSALVGATDAPETGRWVALNISQVGATSAVSVDLAPLGGQAPQAIKYAWGPTGDTPNGGDVMCCELTGAKECLPAQCESAGGARAWGARARGRALRKRAHARTHAPHIRRPHLRRHGPRALRRLAGESLPRANHCWRQVPLPDTADVRPLRGRGEQTNKQTNAKQWRLVGGEEIALKTQSLPRIALCLACSRLVRGRESARTCARRQVSPDLASALTASSPQARRRCARRARGWRPTRPRGPSRRPSRARSCRRC